MRILKNILLLAASAALWGCSKQNLEPCMVKEGEQALVQLSIKASEAAQTTKLTDIQEDAIRTLHVLIFRADGTLQTLKYFGDYQNTTATDRKIPTYSGSGLKIYAVANMTAANTVTSGDADFFNGIRTLSDFESRFTNLISADVDRSYGLMMFGKISGVTISPLPTETIVPEPLYVRRHSAKITVNLRDNTPANQSVDIQSYTICQLPKYTYIDSLASDYYTANPATGAAAFFAQTTVQAFADVNIDIAGVPTDVKQGVFYMFENRRGGRVSVDGNTGNSTNQTEKAKYAPQYATYLLVNARYTTLGGQGDVQYKIYLGADNCADYNVLRNHKYTYNITINGIADADLDSRVAVGQWHHNINVGIWGGTGQDYPMGRVSQSNSAIIKPNSAIGAVTFDIRKCLNNGFTTQDDLNGMLGSASTLTADVLWQDGNVINTADVMLDKVNGLLTVKSSKAVEGNAVVALYPNADKNQGEILWSWHIWVTDYNPDIIVKSNTINAIDTRYTAAGAAGEVHTYGNQYWAVNAGKAIMDRNLGATKTYNGTVPQAGDATADQSFGMFYQWGRKDPFPRWNGMDVSSQATIAIYGPDGTSVLPEDGMGYKKVPIENAMDGTNTLAYAVKNPLTFLLASAVGDWYADIAENQNNALWGNGGSKSVYDPCPDGWRIAPDGTWSDFTRDAATPLNGTFPYYSNGVVGEAYGTGNYTATNGRLYKVSTSETGTPLAWYPAAGAIVGPSVDGRLSGVGNNGESWMSAVSGTNGRHLTFHTKGLNPSNGTYRSNGRTVRCVQE